MKSSLASTYYCDALHMPSVYKLGVELSDGYARVADYRCQLHRSAAASYSIAISAGIVLLGAAVLARIRPRLIVEGDRRQG
jgi:hypothetical protein